MSHRYPTRFQAKIRAWKEKTEIERSSDFMRGMLTKIDTEKCFGCRVTDSIALFEHLYQHPILLSNHEAFREATWKKINEIEKTLLSKLYSLPINLSTNKKYLREYQAEDGHCHGGFRDSIITLLNLLEKIRIKYW